ncbi:hypothetical protein BH10PLA1_BH10PLA1_15020 [soil metagenome]
MRKTGAGCLGAIVSLLAMPFLLAGMRSLFQITGGWNRFIRSDHAYSGMIGLAIGLFGVLIGARWLWYAFRHRGGR